MMRVLFEIYSQLSAGGWSSYTLDCVILYESRPTSESVERQSFYLDIY